MSTRVRHLRPLASPAPEVEPGATLLLEAPASNERRPRRPVRMVVDGVPMLLACPPAPARPSVMASVTPGSDQPMLPLPHAGTGATEPDGAGLDLQRAEQWVAGLAHAVCEVLGRRRPAHQLRGILDDESLALIAAWARLGTLCPEAMGRPHLQASTDDRLEGWLSCRVRGRRLAVALTLERRDQRWRCTGLRVLAPRALTTRPA